MSDIEQRLREAMNGVTLEALIAIAEGYPVRGEADRFVIVENPKFREDDGSDPNICIDTFELRDAARKMADTIASLRSKLEEADGARDRERRRATDAEYMANAYRNMLGPKGLEVAAAWETKGITRVHYDWGPDSFKLTGEQRAEFILSLDHLPTREILPGEIDTLASLREADHA